jgi:hypothetical protein
MLNQSIRLYLAATARTLCVIGLATMITACGNRETCEEPEFYEFAEGGQRIEAPDDLDNLSGNREMRIPEASPRPAREPGSGCLDRPPTLRTDEEETEETET